MQKFRIARTALGGLVLTLLFIAASVKYSSQYPFEETGLTKRQAASFLLDRFTFGARPGDVDKVINIGLKNWFESQLEANQNDDQLNEKLQQYPEANMAEDQILHEYPDAGTILKEAKAERIVPDSVKDFNDPEFRQKIKEFMQEKGYKLPQELIHDLISQKILRAAYSNNQLREVMTDFWFNHFNVSLTTGQTRDYILSYERDAIRSNALGNFRNLLEATAKSPAMLFYLNNAESVADGGKITTAELMRRRNQMRFIPRYGFMNGRQMLNQMMKMKTNNASQKNKKKTGINENYGRELMELHTLGVDGGYTQQDVIEVARCFTGWGIMPRGENLEKLLAKKDQLIKLGFVFDGQFLFRADQHDAEQKIVLGHIIPAGGGINDGEEVLNMLAYNSATAKHISFEIAQKFVSDNPPQSLVNKMAQTFLQTHGDIKSILRMMVKSPEFWKQAKAHSKIKSPFEFAISSLRALNADVSNPMPVSYWISIMGEPLYSYLAPTGYPDNAKTWINTGSLLNRMNFGLILAEGKIKGISFDLYALNNNREPESVEAALKIYSSLLMPERDEAKTIELLKPNIRDPEFAKKISKNVDEQNDHQYEDQQYENKDNNISMMDNSNLNEKTQNVVSLNQKTAPRAFANVVGLIIGSPEFQRR